MIQTKTLNSARDFLSHLRLDHPIWNITIPGDTNWINREEWGFRGQRDSAWPLEPSAFRKTNVIGYKASSKQPTLNYLDQKDQERRALNDFLFFSDRVGIAVPGDNHHYRIPDLPGHSQKLKVDTWPWNFALETLAIAQHHGVPTRLLDFSYDPLTAAFFACYDAWNELGRPSLSKAEDIEKNKKVVVWALHLPLIYKSVRYYPSYGKAIRLILVTAPRAQNSYLHKQEGFFLLDLEADKNNYPSLESAILDVQDEMVQRGKKQLHSPQLIKLELPWKHVPEMLALLWNEFYHIARMQPTFDKSVQALKDHRALYS